MANEKKRRAIFDFHRKIVDILIIQETHSKPECEKIWENEWGGKIIFSHGTPAARGIGIFTSKEIYKQFSNIEIDIEGRYIIVDLCDSNQAITILAIYAPNEDNPVFFRKIAEKLQNRSEHKIIIGDFNLTMDVDIDRKNTYHNNSQARQEVLNIIDQYYLSDIWRVRNPESREYSWFKKDVRMKERKASRIDFSLISKGLDQKIQLVMYLSSLMMDHRGVYIVLELNYNERGVGYWKLNTLLLNDAQYVNGMNRELELTLNAMKEKESYKEKWEYIKIRIKRFSINYSKNKTCEEKVVIANLSEKVNEYEARLPLVEEEDNIYQQTKDDLVDKQLERTSGVMFRSKAKWYELGEKSTKYFYSLEKARYNQKTCFKLIDEDKEITDQTEILELQKSFYQQLYQKDDDVKFTMENTFGIYVPDPQYKSQCEQLSMTDLGKAIKGMNNCKTPGEDGIPVDFYKVFWCKIKGIFFEMMKEVYEKELLHSSARKGILNLIPKPNKDSRYIKNLRPITLLNTDYKIIEKGIANKILPTLEHIIHQDQRGFMKDRRISVNIRKMLDIIQYAEKEDLEAVVMSLDFVKCFDKCSFSILHGSLDFFHFGEVVKKWTRTLYESFTVKIQNNGRFSQPIPINKGVHQGGCCSSLYFLVIAEILALSLRSNEQIDGIKIGDIRNLLNQFADDMDICSECNEQSLREIHQELDSFRRQSGFTVSYDKTTLYRIGSLRHSNAALYNMDEFAWSKEDISILGVTIAHDNLVEKNYQPILAKVKEVLSKWYNRGLSLIGKVQVVNALVASLFVYKMMVLPKIPDTILKNVDNIIRDFLWDKKKSKIGFKILQNPKNAGGLNLVNLRNKEIALKATWPQILAQEKDYAKVVYHLMGLDMIGDNIWRCSISSQDVDRMNIPNLFWKQVLKCWSEFNYYYESRIENQIIWYNSKIKINKKMIWWKTQYERGLMYVYQLFKDGNFKTEQQINEEFSLDILAYNSLKMAIPADWKQFFRSAECGQFMPLPPSNYDHFAISKSKTKLVRVVYKA